MTRRIRRLGYRWHLRQRMAERGMFASTDLTPLLAERGIDLSPVQIYRLVAQTPERLNLHTLAALCDILGCTPADLIEVVVQPAAARKPKAAGGAGDAAGGFESPVPDRQRRPTRARILPDPDPDARSELGSDPRSDR